MTLFRTTIRLAAATVALAGAALIAVPSPAPATGCACLLDFRSGVTISEYTDAFDVAFTGRFVRVIQSGNDYATVLFEVERVYKGEAGALLVASTFYGVCGLLVYPGELLVYPGELSLNPGDEVVLMATKQEGRLDVDFCGAWFTVDMFQEVFGPGYPPGSPPPPAPPPPGMSAAAVALLIWAAGFLLICGAAAAYHLRRPSARNPGPL